MSEDHIRTSLLKACAKFLNQKKEILNKAMNGLKDDLENESKSSAGDKYETGREMINIEWNKLSSQLHQYDQLSVILNRIQAHQATGNIMLGSIVFTEAANYFISVPVGEISVENEKFYAIGAQAPVAQNLLGKKAGETFDLNGIEFNILEVI